ncbi:MAG: transcriptional regulator [Chloroflexota bacterium]|nr:MAG: transcriptional regulator [Chloroflexota bacterium]HDD62495.1 transcriptional regulator [Chloroflexota bacterium]
MVNSKEDLNNFPTADLDQIIHAPARLRILMMLYVVESLDYVFLKNQTNMSWGNLATHLNKLEDAGYITVKKGYRGKKPQSQIQLTPQGRTAFRDYKNTLQQILDDLPE